MSNYYSEKLNSGKLFQVYDTAIPRIRQYLDAEIDFVRSSLTGTESVLELAAGYGRIMKELAPRCSAILGIDISEDSVLHGREFLRNCPNASLLTMDVHNLSFDRGYDVILCLQNGLSAMKATHSTIESILRFLNPGGSAFFSTYSSRFWGCRLAWFREQAGKGLLGEIDAEKTGDGVIICKDGFTATTHTPEDFEEIGKRVGLPYRIVEVDESSLFLIIRKEGALGISRSSV